MDRDPFSQRFLKTDPYPKLVKYSPDVLKKQKKDLDIFDTDNEFL